MISYEVKAFKQNLLTTLGAHDTAGKSDRSDKLKLTATGKGGLKELKEQVPDKDVA